MQPLLKFWTFYYPQGALHSLQSLLISSQCTHPPGPSVTANLLPQCVYHDHLIEMDL